MLTEPPSEALDLLVVGALTIDRLPDGSAAPGGSTIHIARAAAPRGVRLGVITAAGPESEVTAGLAELRSACVSVEAAQYEVTTTFRHSESAVGRRLWLERLGGSVAVGRADSARISAGAILYAPVAGEITADALSVWDDGQARGAILQGWLRSTTEGAEVVSMPLSSLVPSLLEALGQLDVLVASREDLVADAAAPDDQLAALRDAVGPGPALFVTDGPDGLWLDLADSRPRSNRRLHIPAPWRVDTSSTVGAGDILAAFLTMRDRDPSAGWPARARKAMRVVAEVLEERKRG